MARNLRERLGSIDPFNAAFVACVKDDERLIPFDIEGSLAHARMLAKVGLLRKEETAEIQKGLKQILKEWKLGELSLDSTLEDVHMNVEHRLGQLTLHAAKLHTGRSRNDQVALDLRLWTRAECQAVINEIRSLQEALVGLADRHRDTLMPGVTHLQHAQPILFAHALLAWHDMLERDGRRFRNALEQVNVSPLGAAALAGTSLAIDPDMVANDLRFSACFKNSIDAVSDRDFAVDFVAAGAMLMAHLSQMAEMLIIWSTPEFGFVGLPDDLCTSSSLMPQKKNPDMLELVRAKAGQLAGALVSLLSTLKGLPIGYNRDLQETKRPLFEAADTCRACLKAMALAFSMLKVDEKQMLAASHDAQMLATDLAEYLVRKGVPFRDAHGAVGRLSRHCAEQSRTFINLTLKTFKKFHAAFDKDVLRLLSPRESVWRRASPGGTGTKRVHERLSSLQREPQ